MIGDAVTIAQNAFIRSHLATNVGGMAFSAAQQGFILRSDGQFLFGNATNSIKWDNAKLDIKGDITAGTIGRLNIKTTGLPSLYTGGSIMFANQFSLRSTNSQATDLWLTDNISFNNGTLNSTVPYAGMAIGSNSTGITRGAVEVGMKAVTGSNVEALNYVQMTSVGILMKQRDYITTSDNKAYVPAASFNANTSILTIFLPGS